MKNTKVAILISTKDRPEFLERTLNYYAKIGSPHPIYISDSSNTENAKRIEHVIDNLKSKLAIKYSWYPPGLEVTGKTLNLVKEDYALIQGDDDYYIPDTLTKGAKFLENNPEYAVSGGYGISFRLRSSGPHGEIKKLTDYPFYSIEAETASQRLVDFLKICYVTTSGVNRVENLKKVWVTPLPIISTWSELFQISYGPIMGKIKVLDYLGIVRHIHDKQYHINLMVDWLTDKEFYNYYQEFKNHLAAKIMEIDSITRNEAELAVKNAFWEYLKVAMANDIKGLRPQKESTANASLLKSLRTKIGTSIPVLKTAYRQYLRPYISDKKQMHYEVTNPRSSYYEDFQHVADSFTGKDLSKS